MEKLRFKKPMFRVASMSDVHLEWGTIPSRLFVQYQDTDTLVIAGDFGYYTQAVTIEVLRRLRAMYEYVIVVAGNHEYQMCSKRMVSVEYTDQEIKQVCENLGVHYLQKAVFQHPRGVTFLGCTLWSDISQSSAKHMTDFGRVFEIRDEYLALHKDHRQWLYETIPKHKTVIVVTHHLPTFAAIHPDYHRSDNSGYASHLEFLFSENVIGWFCGHTHAPNQLLIKNTLLTINPFGYPGEVIKGTPPKMPVEFLLPTKPETHDSSKPATHGNENVEIRNVGNGGIAS